RFVLSLKRTIPKSLTLWHKRIGYELESARLFAPSSNLTTTQKEQLTRARYLQIYSCGQPDSSLATKLSAQLIECNSEHEQQKLALCYEPLPSLICDDNFEFKDKLSYLA
ncbi:hypothetical protein, partial [Enterococcus faecium]|uniref:hypothetical protein n=1 Tax=Enterococcus faecium TaxID=1352 RepID=UPI0034E97CE4